MNTDMENTTPLPKIMYYTKRCVHFLFITFIEPRSLNEDSQRREFILNIILSGLIVLLVIFDIIILRDMFVLGSSFRGVPFSVFTGIVVFFILLLFLSRRGYFIEASYTLIIAYFIGSTYGIYHWG